MAVSRYIPKNIKSYKPKYFWGLTTRQCISLLISGVLILIFIKASGSLSMELRIYLSSIPAVLPMLFGFLPIYGMPLEQFLPEVWHDYFKSSQRRYRILVASLSLKTEKKPLKLDRENKPLSVCRKK